MQKAVQQIFMQNFLQNPYLLLQSIAIPCDQKVFLQHFLFHIFKEQNLATSQTFISNREIDKGIDSKNSINYQESIKQHIKLDINLSTSVITLINNNYQFEIKALLDDSQVNHEQLENAESNYLNDKKTIKFNR